MKTITRIILAALAASFQALLGQGVGIGTSTPHPSAMLELSSTTKGLLIPRLADDERQALPDPATGLLIFNTTTGELNFYDGSSWRRIPSSIVSTQSGTGIPSGEGVLIDQAGGTGAPDPSALLEVVASDKGLLIPRTKPSSISAPAAGLAIYNTSTDHLNYYDGSVWREPCGVLIDNNKGTGAVGAGVAINVTNTPPDPSARLDVSHTSKGLLLPRLTSAQRDALISPATGLIIFNVTTGRIEYWQGTQWMSLMELPLQPSAISGPTSVCQGAANVSYSVTNVPGVSYDWTYSGSGFTITGGGGTNAITGNFSSSATSGTLTVTPSNACGNGPARSLSITVNSAPSGPVSANASATDVCSGSSVDLYASDGTGGDYVWYAGGCGYGSPIGTGTPITVNPTSTTTYYVRRENSCGNTPCASVTVNVTGEPTGTVSASASATNVCSGSSVDLYASGGTGGDYVWYAGGCGYGSFIGTGTPITVNPTSTTTYYVRRESSCGSTGCASVMVTVGSSLPPDGTITGPSSVCPGETYIYSTTDNASSYTWSTDLTGASISGSGSTATLYVPAGVPAGSVGNVYVVPSSDCGDGNTRAIGVSVLPDPSNAGSILGPMTVCRPSSGLTYTLYVPGATGYSWSYSGGGVNITSYGDHAELDFLSGATSGDLTVTVTHPCGNITRSLYITVGGTPQVTVQRYPQCTQVDFSCNQNCTPTCCTPEITCTYPNATYEMQAIVTGEGDIPASISWSHGDTGSSTWVSYAGTFCATASNICGTSTACGQGNCPCNHN